MSEGLAVRDSGMSRLLEGAGERSFPEVDGDGRRVLEGSARRKRALGQYFTEGSCWLQPQVEAFIRASECSVVYDPFAGSGALFQPVLERVEGVKRVLGLDVDVRQGWEVNDSLIRIPPVADAIIVTNPPYMSNYSATRKRLGGRMKAYFAATAYDDLYLLALERMLEAQRYVVAIVPESFLNSSFQRKDLLHSITILEENPFRDTDTPVAVLCFDSRPKELSEVLIFKGSRFVCSLRSVEDCRLQPDYSVEMKFNDPTGWLGVRCVDTTNCHDRLRFDFKERIDYDWEKGIKVSSRLLTLISLQLPEASRQGLIDGCNERLEALRRRSHDLVLSPFKGNMQNGVRRRRLDFQTCRALVESTYRALFPSAEPARLIQGHLTLEMHG